MIVCTQCVMSIKIMHFALLTLLQCYNLCNNNKSLTLYPRNILATVGRFAIVFEIYELVSFVEIPPLAPFEFSCLLTLVNLQALFLHQIHLFAFFEFRSPCF